MAAVPGRPLGDVRHRITNHHLDVDKGASGTAPGHGRHVVEGRLVYTVDQPLVPQRCDRAGDHHVAAEHLVEGEADEAGDVEWAGGRTQIAHPDAEMPDRRRVVFGTFEVHRTLG